MTSLIKLKGAILQEGEQPFLIEVKKLVRFFPKQKDAIKKRLAAFF